MEKIDPSWIRQRTKDKHGAMKRLGDAIGLTSDKMTKIMNGTRKISGDEAIGIYSFFQQRGAGEGDMEFDEAALSKAPSGFSESQAKLWTPPKDFHSSALIAALKAIARHGQTYEIARPSPSLGLLMGDILIIDLNTPPKDGDVVLIGLQVTEGPDDVQTLVRRLQKGFAVSADPGEVQPIVELGDQAAWRGTVLSMFRPTM